MHGIVQDITDSKRVENALVDSESKFRSLFDSVTDGIFILDIDGNFIDANRTAYERLGYTRDELLAIHISVLDPPEFAAKVPERLAQIREYGSAVFESAHLRKDGSVMPVEVNSRLLEYEGRNVYLSVIRDITERKREEGIARERGLFIESIVNLSTDVLYIYDLVEQRNVYSNEGISAVLGYSPEDMQAMGDRLLPELMHPEDFKSYLEETVPRYARAEDKESITHKFRMRDKSGAWHWLDCKEIVYRRGSDGSPRQIFGVVHDVTEQTRAEEELKSQEKRLAESQRIAHVGSWEHNLETNQVFWSDELFRLLGLDPEKDDADFDIFFSMVHPDDQQRLKKAVEETLQKQTPFNIEYRFVLRDGTTRIIHAQAELLPDSSGKPVILSGTGQDITERRQAENALIESEGRLRESQEVAKIGSWSLDMVNDVLEWSRETYRRFEKDPAMFKPTTEYFLSRVHPDDREGIRKAIEDSLAHDAPYHIQPRIRNEDGRDWVLEGFGRVERDAEGQPVRFAGTAQDITERKLVEDKLRESEEYIRNILDTVDEGFIVVDRDYRIMTANKAYCRQVSLPCEEVVGSHCYGVSHLSERPCFEAGEECPVRDVFATGEPHTAVHKHLNRDGEILFVEVKAFPNKNESGDVASVIEMISNITERHLLEEERLKTQKLESIGTLAGGIAHDFNNLLQGVFSHISMARMSIDRKEESMDMLNRAEEALHQTVSLTNQLLTFAKGGKPVKEHVSVLPVVENATRFALSGSSCDYEILPQGDLWQVSGDAGQIGQVIQNIALNADQSMPQGGRISVTVSNVPADRKRPAALKNGDYVLISIRDSGSGVPEESRERIFDPYFTTKEKGSGLGLATSHSIIRNHDGIIDVESRPGEGATFTIYLPAVHEKIEEPAEASAPAEARSAKVLVMDDEEMIRKITVKLVRALGHECEFAEKGESAVAMFKAARDEGRPFDLVLLDLTIRGGMGGVETVRELLAIDPEVKAIVSTGYSDDAALSNYRSQGFRMFLKKPYNVEELRDVINSLLG
jgi:PAS domain S-box-containing protein